MLSRRCSVLLVATAGGRTAAIDYRHSGTDRGAYNPPESMHSVPIRGLVVFGAAPGIEHSCNYDSYPPSDNQAKAQPRR